MRLADERTRRATGNALPAVDATRHIDPLVERSAHRHLGAAIDKTNAGNRLYFVADSDTFTALNTFFAISDNRFPRRIDGIRAALPDKSPTANSKRLRKFSKLTIPIPFTKKTIIGMIGEEQLHDHSSGIRHTITLRIHLHSRSNRKGTCGDKIPLSFNLHHTNPAGSRRREPFIITQGGDFHSGTAKSGQEHFSLSGINLTTINNNLDSVRHY
jgi:hypothetical protein